MFLDADNPQVEAFAWQLIGWGFLLAVLGLIVALHAWRQPAYPRHRKPLATVIAERPGSWLLLAFLMLLGLVLRVHGLDAKGLSHPEIYIPGIDLPLHSEPPSRTDFFRTLRWHMFRETHPFGYYMAMWAWTKVFGASAFSIRLPEAIMGGLSVAAIYRVAALTFDRRIALISAALLSLHGFHIFWSQSARMYAPGTLFGLLATMFLIEAMRDRTPRRWVVPGYVLSLVACASTVEFAWPLFGIHILWLAIKAPSRNDAARVAMAIALAAILSAPMLAAADVAPKPPGTPHPSLGFLVNYFSFGFLYEHGAYTDPTPGPLPAYRAVLATLTLVLVGFGLWRGKEKAPAGGRPAPTGWRSMLPVAFGAAIIMLGFTFSTHRHRVTMLAITLIPFLGLLLPAIITWIATWCWPRRLLLLSGRLGQNATGLVALLAFWPMLALFVVSFVLPMTAPRAFLIFVPYELIITAVGIAAVLDIAPLVVSAALGVALLAIFVASIVQERRIPTSPRDYRGIGQAISAHLRAGDRIWLPAQSWLFTPLSLYVPHSRLEQAQLAEIGAKPAKAPIWVVHWDESPCIPLATLPGYRPADMLVREQATACRYAPPATMGTPSEGH